MHARTHALTFWSQALNPNPSIGEVEDLTHLFDVSSLHLSNPY